jgi:hypothetical protein
MAMIMKLEYDLVNCREQLGPAGYCYNKLTFVQELCKN